MRRVRDGKNSRDLGIEHDSREDVGVLHSRGLNKDNYNMHHLHTE
jgi:hypothetical protein